MLGRLSHRVVVHDADCGSGFPGAEMTRLSIHMGRGAERLPASIALALIPSLPRPQLERLVQKLIDGMDEADGDTDREPEETDHSRSEDDFDLAPNDNGAGCPISDPDVGVDDIGEPNGDEMDTNEAEDDATRSHPVPAYLAHRIGGGS